MRNGNKWQGHGWIVLLPIGLGVLAGLTGLLQSPNGVFVLLALVMTAVIGWAASTA